MSGSMFHMKMGAQQRAFSNSTNKAAKMNESLFGELQQANATGVSKDLAPCFISNDVFAFAAGDCINFRALDHLKQTEPYPSIPTKAQVTALAAFPQEGVIAYAEKYSRVIKILKWPQLVPFGVQNGELEAADDLEILSLAFSSDGQYLVSLGSLPGHTISLWDWRGNIQRPRGDTDPLLSSVSNNGPATQISFNPMDKKMICTSNPACCNGEPYPDDEFDLDATVGDIEDGLCRGIRFWKLFMGSRKWDLSQMYQLV